MDEPIKKPTKVKMVDVRVIEKTSKSLLVEYYDPKQGSLRVTIPTGIIKENQVPLEELEAGIPYGVDWGKAKIKQIDPETLSKAFRDEGIFTVAELGQKRTAALACIARLSGLLLSDILDQFK